MGKKLLLMATVCGILSLGACVDDKESQSTIDVRNAKAAQLKSLAELASAQAEAAKALALADAALKTAEAEAIKVKNDLAKVQIDKEKVELELAQVRLDMEKERNNLELQEAAKVLENRLLELENEKARLELEKKDIAAQLERQALILEEELISAQIALLRAQDELKNQKNNLDEAENQQLQNKVNAYSLAMSTLNVEKRNLLNMQSYLVSLENNLVDYKEWRANTVERLAKEKAANLAEIAAYKKYSNYLADIEKTKLEYDEKDREYRLRQDKYNVEQSKYNDLKSALIIPTSEAIMESAYVQAVSKVYAGGSNYRIYSPWGYSYEYYSWNSDLSNSEDYFNQIKYDYIEKEINSNYPMTRHEYNTIIPVSSPNIDKLSTFKPIMDNNLITATNDQKVSADEVKAREQYVKDTKKIWDDLEKDENATGDEKEQAARDYNNALNQLDDANNELSKFNDVVEKMKEQLATLATIMDPAAYAAYVKAVTDYNVAVLEAVTPVAEAKFVYETYYYNEVLPIEKERTVLYNMLYNNNGADWTASGLDAEIKRLEEANIQIDKNQEWLSLIANTEESIEFQKIDIETQQAVVAVAQIYADNAKAALDAAMPKAE